MDLTTIYNAIQEVKSDVKALDSKIDGHSERIVKVEERTASMSGAIKAIVTTALAVLSSIVVYIFQSVTGHK